VILAVALIDSLSSGCTVWLLSSTEISADGRVDRMSMLQHRVVDVAVGM